MVRQTHFSGARRLSFDPEGHAFDLTLADEPFDIRIDDPGLYPFVSHAFAAVDESQLGLLKVGDW